MKTLDEDGSDSAAIAHLSWNSSTFKKYPDCTFKFEVGRPFGIYATIRKLKLRQRSESGDCIDYVRMKNSFGLKTTNMCGSYDANDSQNDKLPFSSDEPGIMSISVYLDTYRPLDKLEDTLEISIAFVAYESKFYFKNKENKMKINSTFVLTECLVPSSEQIMCTPGHCVSKSLKHTGIVHCPPSICLDEETCVNKPVVEYTFNSSNIALSAITSLIFTMFAVGLCMWFCWKYSACCSNNSQQQQQNRHNRSPPNRSANGDLIVPHELEFGTPRHLDIEMGADSRQGRSSGNSLPQSAPSIDDKDLPPSYESLFPQKPPETASPTPAIVNP